MRRVKPCSSRGRSLWDAMSPAEAASRRDGIKPGLSSESEGRDHGNFLCRALRNHSGLL